MARGGLIGFGVILIVLAGAGYITPFPFTLAGENLSVTIPKMVAICDSGLGQLAQLSPDMVMLCSQNQTLMFGIYGSGLLGIILIIVGGLTGGKKESEEELEEEDESLEILKKRYAKGEITKKEFWNKASEEEKDPYSALDILKQRYSRLEITKDEYEEKKKDLENS